MASGTFDAQTWDEKARSAGVETMAFEDAIELSFGRGPFAYAQGKLRARDENAEAANLLMDELWESEANFLALHQWLLEQGRIVHR